MPNITKRLVDALDASAKDYVMWDDKLKGFGIKVTPKGKKIYLLKCRMKTGLQRKYTLGAHGAITCEQGRKLAQDYLYQISQGIDPSESYNKPTDTSLASLCDRYFTDYALVHKKSSSIKNNRTYIERYIKPKIGSLMVSSITRNDIIEFHKELKNSPIQANRVVKMLSKVFSLSEEWNLRPENTNPARNIRMYPENKRERFLSLDEIRRLMSALDECEADKTVSIHACAMFRLLLLTGARLREIMHARWEWVDMQRGTLSLPDSKTGAKVIYLSSHALNVLHKVPKVASNPFIIVGRDEGKPLNSERKQWLRICERAGLQDVRIHDLRHSFASLAVLGGVPLYHVGKALGHRQASTTERYAHLADDPVRAVAEMIGEAIK
jgi:integrase